MHSKASLEVILIAMLLTHSLHGVRWQGTGSGMNNTVISEIWNGLEMKVDNALNIIATRDAVNLLVNDISTRLNTQWGQAWNVVITIGNSIYDTILYGYAFNNQWMWYNGVPFTGQNTGNMVTLIVWKDYNCQDWKNIASGADERSSFTTDQKNAIKAEIDKMTLEKLTNDVWGAAFTMMDNLGKDPLFSSGGYSVVFSQNGGAIIYGRVCRVGDGFYYSLNELSNRPIFPASNIGLFYLFQTR